MHALIVGEKNIGKSTLIQKIILQLNCKVCGYLTVKEDNIKDELGRNPIYIYEYGKSRIQSKNNLIGYSDGRHCISFKEIFDRAASILSCARTDGDIVVMDEIGTMEEDSNIFCREVLTCLDGSKPVIAAVKNRHTPYLDQIRNHPNCRVFYIDESNRDELAKEVIEYLYASSSSISTP